MYSCTLPSAAGILHRNFAAPGTSTAQTAGAGTRVIFASLREGWPIDRVPPPDTCEPVFSRPSAPGRLFCVLGDMAAFASPNGAHYDSPGQRPGVNPTQRARALKGRPIPSPSCPQTPPNAIPRPLLPRPTPPRPGRPSSVVHHKRFPRVPSRPFASLFPTAPGHVTLPPSVQCCPDIEELLEKRISTN